MDHEPIERQPEPPHPNIWVGCLAAYNDGTLHGRWIDAAREPDELWEDINAVLGTSPVPNAEEFLIFDHENFGDLRLGESESIERVSMIARGIVEHGQPFASWLNYVGIPEDDDWLELFQDSYIGTFESEDALADHLADDLGIEPEIENLRTRMPGVGLYIIFDAEAYLRDLNLGGDLFMRDNPDGSVDAFWSR